MRSFSLALAATVLLSATSSLSAEPESQAKAGRLHLIDIRARHPQAYRPSIGDVVQCYMDFPIGPEQIVENLEVTTAGRTLSVMGVVGTSSPKIVGSGQISLYLMPRQLGVTKVTIQPSIPGQNPKPIEINFSVEEERRD